jgi:transcriptional regulator with XRE-family HTH domain
MAKKKTKKKPSNLGEDLKESRLVAGLSVRSVADNLRINEKLLREFEANKHHDSEDLYVRGHLVTYAKHLGVDISKHAKKHKPSAHPNRRVARAKFKPLQGLVATRSISVLAGLLGAILALFIVMILIFSLLSPPKLNLVSPLGDSEHVGTSIDVKGSTSPGSEIFINDNPVPVDLDGNFFDVFLLREGLNEIEIKAINSLSRVRVINRTIVAEYPPEVTGQSFVD